MDVKQLKILIIDDQKFQRTIVLKVLKSMGIEVFYETADGVEALDLIQREKVIDVLICDLKMPDMDGMEFIRHLGEMKFNIPVILASGMEHTVITSIDMMAQHYDVDILGVIEKPTTRSKLEPLLSQYVTSKNEFKPTNICKRANVSPISQQEILRGLKNEEFEPFYQPKVNISNRRLVGAEALARWRHPTKGLLPPNLFIPQMEQDELIDALTWLMLKKSARQCAEWRAAGLELSISINLSIKSLTNTDFADQIIELMHAYQIDPHHIIFEITESATTTQFGQVLENLARLRIQQFALSIDDYGTGYSSMQQLMTIPYNELKIDQSFISNMAQHKSARVIVGSSLMMAKKLKLQSVAEGVESLQDWTTLENLGCTIAQGYYISKPLPRDEFYNWALQWNKEHQSYLLDKTASAVKKTH